MHVIVEKTTRQRLIKLTAEELGIPEEQAAAADLAEYFKADTLGRLAFRVALENEFDVDISDKEADSLLSLEDFLDLIIKKQSDQG